MQALLSKSNLLLIFEQHETLLSLTRVAFTFPWKSQELWCGLLNVLMGLTPTKLLLLMKKVCYKNAFVHEI